MRAAVYGRGGALVKSRLRRAYLLWLSDAVYNYPWLCFGGFMGQENRCAAVPAGSDCGCLWHVCTYRQQLDQEAAARRAAWEAELGSSRASAAAEAEAAQQRLVEGRRKLEEAAAQLDARERRAAELWGEREAALREQEARVDAEAAQLEAASRQLQGVEERLQVSTAWLLIHCVCHNPVMLPVRPKRDSKLANCHLETV